MPHEITVWLNQMTKKYGSRLSYRILIWALMVSCSSGNKPPDQLVNSESTSIPNKLPAFSITNLYDAFGKENGLTKDFGFSALIQLKDRLILFDAGTNADILKTNVEKLGIDLGQVDYAIASHAHGDHTNGFDYVLSVNPKIKLYLPSDFFIGASLGLDVAGREPDIRDSLPQEMRYYSGSEPRLDINQSGRYWKANTEFVTTHLEIEPGIRLIATTSPFLGYGSRYPSVDQEIGEIQFRGLPELSLAISTSEGVVVVVGCSHSSVQMIIEETKDETGNEIALVYGGYHMLPYGRDELYQVANKLKQEYGVKKIAPTHCTGHLAFKLLKDAYGEDYLFAGLGETITF